MDSLVKIFAVAMIIAICVHVDRIEKKVDGVTLRLEQITVQLDNLQESKHIFDKVKMSELELDDLFKK